MQFKRQGGELYATCPFHTDGKRPNFRVNIEKNTWFCDVCGEGGGAVEFIAKKQGRDKNEVFKELIAKEQGSAPSSGERIVATYDYHDRMGNLVYQVCRYYPKTFRQRRPNGSGGWEWNMQGVERVLYRLQDVQKKKFIWIVEGEKDAETLQGIGMAATCNVGGAGKWHDAYSECLKGKDVVLCGDNDDAGRKHMEKVLASVEPHANSVRRIEFPADFKDISDFASTFPNTAAFAEALAKLMDAAPVMIKGGALPIKSMAELEAAYIEDVTNSKTQLVKLSDWIPSLGCVRPLVRGELVSLVGDTGTCKTYILQNIALACRVPTLLFELELPDSLTFERFVSICSHTSGNEVYSAYSQGNRMDYADISHVYTCTRSGLTVGEMETIINRSELRMGVRPTLVLVDYIQLVSGMGKSRYERMSAIAEQLKAMAKNTGTVVILASQVGRDKETPEIGLHDAKDSGSIENSSGLVLGMWRDEHEPEIINLKVLKNTKGRPTSIIQCKIDSPSMRIVEKSRIDDDDVPKQKQQKVSNL